MKLNVVQRAIKWCRANGWKVVARHTTFDGNECDPFNAVLLYKYKAKTYQEYFARADVGRHRYEDFAESVGMKDAHTSVGVWWDAYDDMLGEYLKVVKHAQACRKLVK